VSAPAIATKATTAAHPRRRFVLAENREARQGRQAIRH
jgi:hypothetical protein